MFGEVFTVVCALLGIIGLMFLAFYAAGWLRKHLGGGSFGSGQTVRIIECVGIAQDKQLIIVSVGKKYMLLGVTANSVNKICDLDEEDIASGEGEPSSSASGFMQNLKKAFAERERAAASEQTENILDDNTGGGNAAENRRIKEDGQNEKDDF